MASIGAVIFSDRLKCPQFYGFTVTEGLVDHWKSSGSKQIIFQAELLPVLVSKRVWQDALSYSRNLWAIDNEGAREGLIRSYSSSWTAREILLSVNISDIRSSALDWYLRIPTAANFADLASRLKFEELLGMGCERVEVRPVCLEDIRCTDVLAALMAKSGGAVAQGSEATGGRGFRVAS